MPYSFIGRGGRLESGEIKLAVAVAADEHVHFLPTEQFVLATVCGRCMEIDTDGAEEEHGCLVIDPLANHGSHLSARILVPLSITDRGMTPDVVWDPVHRRDPTAGPFESPIIVRADHVSPVRVVPLGSNMHRQNDPSIRREVPLPLA